MARKPHVTLLPGWVDETDVSSVPKHTRLSRAHTTLVPSPSPGLDAGSLGLDVGRLNQCGARHDVLPDIRIEFGRAHDHRIDAEGCQLLPDLRRIQRLF